MKKLISFMLSMTCLLCAVSCGKKPEDITPEQLESSSQAEEISSEDIHSYKSEEIEMPFDGGFYQAVPLSDGKYRLFGSDNNGSLYIYDTDSDFRNFTSVESELGFKPDYNNCVLYCIADDDSMYAVATHCTHGDMSEPPKDFDENFDYETYYSASEYTYSFLHLDKNGKKISETPMDWLSEYANEYAYGQTNVSSMVYCGNDILLANVENSLIFINCKDGTQLEKLDTENTWGTLYADRDGKPVYIYESADDSGVVEYNICGIDAENRKLSDDKTTFSDYFNGYIRGSGKYRYYIVFPEGIYGFTDDGQKEFLIDFLESNISGNSSMPLLALDNSDFIMTDYSTNKMSRYVKRSADEITQKQIITLGHFTNDDDSINSEVIKFNNSHDDIQVKIKEIESVEQLKLDIISGNAPDIIINYDISTVKSLANKGVFANLYDLMENDSEVNKDTVMPNVMKACESGDGNLYMLPQSFYVYAGFVKTKYFDSQECTFSDLIDLYNKYPEMGRKYHTRDEMFEDIFKSSDDFVDYENATCSFDSPEFINILKFCNQFPEELDIPDKWDDTEGFENYHLERVFDFIKDRDLIAYERFYDFNSFNYYKYGYFANDNAEIVNCPSVDKSGAKIGFDYGFVISESSVNKQACWEFVKSFLDEENQQCGNGYGNGFPVMKEYFYKSADESMQTQDINTVFKGTGEEIPPLSKEERDFYCDYIINSDSCMNYYNESILNICDEEADAYFGGGQSAEQTAGYIQNRVSILLSEQS